MIVVRDREAGNIIDEVLSYDEGLELIKRFENEDKTNNMFVPDFYEVAKI